MHNSWYYTNYKRFAMKRTKTKRITKKSFVIAAVIAVILVGALVFLVRQRNTPSAADTSQPKGQEVENKINYNPPTEEEKKQAAAQKEEIINNIENPPVAADLTVSIVRATQADKGATLNIRALVSGATSGTCLVKLTRDDQASIEKSFPITFEATNSMCKGADIAASEFGAGGDWQLSITAQSGGKASAAATKTVTINK